MLIAILPRGCRGLAPFFLASRHINIHVHPPADPVRLGLKDLMIIKRPGEFKQQTRAQLGDLSSHKTRMCLVMTTSSALSTALCLRSCCLLSRLPSRWSASVRGMLCLMTPALDPLAAADLLASRSAWLTAHPLKPIHGPRSGLCFHNPTCPHQRGVITHNREDAQGAVMTAGQQKSLNAYKQRKAWWGSCECHDTGQGHLRIVGTHLTVWGPHTL